MRRKPSKVKIEFVKFFKSVGIYGSDQEMALTVLDGYTEEDILDIAETQIWITNYVERRSPNFDSLEEAMAHTVNINLIFGAWLVKRKQAKK